MRAACEAVQSEDDVGTPPPGAITNCLSVRKTATPRRSNSSSLVYAELRRIASRATCAASVPGIRCRPPLSSTRVCLRLLKDEDCHFRIARTSSGIAARSMRQILVEHARAQDALAQQ